MNTILNIASVLLVTLFVGVAIWKMRELPESISAMVYDLPRRLQYQWSAWLCVVSILLFEPLVSRVEFLGWLTIVCLVGAALTPLIQQETRT